MTTYTVTVTRGDDLWVAHVDGLPKGVVGAADYEHFGELHTDVLELIADLTDTDPAEFTIDWRYEFAGRDVTAEVRRMLDVTRNLRELQQEQDRARRVALAAMADVGLSQRTMADVVELSHQRVHQLLKAS